MDAKKTTEDCKSHVKKVMELIESAERETPSNAVNACDMRQIMSPFLGYIDSLETRIKALERGKT